MDPLTIYITTGVLAIFFAGIRIVRPIEKGLIETLGKYSRTAEQGFSWIIPVIQKMTKVNITEQMVDVEPQMVITKDKLNAEVDAVVYYKIFDTKKALYNVDDHKKQLVSLARTTLRAVIGKMSLTEANENRDEINTKVEGVLEKETKSYGVEVLRVELQKVEPPQDVQDAMNKVVKAEQEKISAKDFANATEIKADGDKRAEIKRAEGIKQGEILRAEGEAKAKIMLADAEAKKIQLENSALQKYFKGSARDYKSLDVTKVALKQGTKYVIDSNSKITNVISDTSGVIPIKK
jgi:regulator of protease activity HflC (stomatin/prohibitin superfamily)